MSLHVGDRLVPKNTPRGPEAARLAWANALGRMIVILDRNGDELTYACDDFAYPRSGSEDSLLKDYDRP